MSKPRKVFQRLQTYGWLVLSSTLPSLGGETPQLTERLLERIDLSYLPLFLTTDETIDFKMQEFIDDVETLLDVPVTVIRIQRVSKAELDEACMNASLIVLAGSRVDEWIKIFDPSTAILMPEQMMGESKLVLVSGSAASIMGSWTFMEHGNQLIPGLGWLPGAVVLPEVLYPTESPDPKQLLSEQKFSYALGITQGAILALGPEGEIEVWSETTPVVTLGTGWGDT